MSKTTVEIVGKETVSQAAARASSASKELSGATGGLIRDFTDLTAAGFVVGKVIRELAQFAEESIQSFAEQERAVVAWGAAMDLSGQISFEAKGALSEFSEAMGRLTGVDDEAILSIEAFLSTAGRTEEEIRRIISAAADMSVVTEDNLRGAVEKLNATYSGTAGRLEKLVPALDDLTEAELKAGDAIDIIAEQYEGLATAMSETADVSIKNFKNSVDDLHAALGSRLSEAFTPMRNAISGIVEKWTEALEEYNAYRKALREGDPELAAARKLVIDREKEVKAQEKIRGMNLANFGVSGNDSDLEAAKRLLGQAQIALKMLENARAKENEETGGSLNTKGANGTNGKAGADNIADVIGEAVGVVLEKYFPGGSNDVDKTNAGYGYAGWVPPLENFEEQVEEGPSLMDTIGGILGEIGGVFKGVFDSILPMIGTLGSVMALMDPLGTILQGVMDILGPLIDTLLAPLVGILRIVGQTIGKLLAPALELLGPIITAVSKAFVFLYNNVVRPIYNGLMTVFNLIYNGFVGFINGILWMIDQIPFVDVGRVAYRDLDAGYLQEIGMADLTSAGTSTTGAGTSGGSASYSRPRDINIYIELNTPALVGEGGFREFSLMVNREIKGSGVLGLE